MYGPLLQQTFGFDDAAMAEFVRSQVEPLLTLPFGEVNVSDLMSMGPPRNGGPPPTWRERRRYIIHMMDSDGLGSRFDRAQFLLGKQLVYFERYGQLFMADTPLLSDPAFYKALLAEAV